MYKIIFLALCLLLIGCQDAETVNQDAEAVNITKPKEVECHPRFGAIPLTDEIKASILKFQNLESCLKKNAPKDGELDINTIDWDKLKNDADAKICLFIIFEQLEGPAAVMAWLEKQGLEPFGPIKQGKGSKLLSTFDYDVSNEAMDSYEILGVQGYWSLRWHFPKFPTSGFARYYRPVLSRGQNIYAVWFPDGKLMSVSVFYDSIFN